MADRRQDQRHDANSQHREDELLAERHGGHELGLVRPVRAPDRAEQLARDLHEALGPAALLGAEIVELGRQLADHMRLHQEHAVPARERGAQHQVEVLRQGVVRPAARLLDRGAPPDAAGAVELEGHAAAGADVLLDGEMRVLHQPLRPRQPVLLAIAPFDAGLHEGGARLGQQRRHGAAQPARLGHEVGVEHRDIGCVAELQALGQGAGLEARAVVAPDVGDVDAVTLRAAPRRGRRCRR